MGRAKREFCEAIGRQPPNKKKLITVGRDACADPDNECVCYKISQFLSMYKLFRELKSFQG